MALTKRKLVSWLLNNGFEKSAGRQTSFQHFKHKPSGVTVTVDGKGRPELSKKHTGMLMRQLERAGFDKEQVRKELA